MVLILIICYFFTNFRWWWFLTVWITKKILFIYRCIEISIITKTTSVSWVRNTRAWLFIIIVHLLLKIRAWKLIIDVYLFIDCRRRRRYSLIAALILIWSCNYCFILSFLEEWISVLLLRDIIHWVVRLLQATTTTVFLSEINAISLKRFYMINYR